MPLLPNITSNIQNNWAVDDIPKGEPRGTIDEPFFFFFWKLLTGFNVQSTNLFIKIFRPSETNHLWNFFTAVLVRVFRNGRFMGHRWKKWGDRGEGSGFQVATMELSKVAVFGQLYPNKIKCVHSKILGIFVVKVFNLNFVFLFVRK